MYHLVEENITGLCFLLIDWVYYQFITDKYFIISQECNEFDDRRKQPSRRNKKGRIFVFIVSEKNQIQNVTN